jgi:hypothetical protein
VFRSLDIDPTVKTIFFITDFFTAVFQNSVNNVHYNIFTDDFPAVIFGTNLQLSSKFSSGNNSITVLQ